MIKSHINVGVVKFDLEASDVIYVVRQLDAIFYGLSGKEEKKKWEAMANGKNS